ncbi:sortase domain-bontaining protein [Periweissella cryptocerci]|nr:sortase [Periweissella cryptocerci]
MKKRLLLVPIIAVGLLISCGQSQATNKQPEQKQATSQSSSSIKKTAPSSSSSQVAAQSSSTPVTKQATSTQTEEIDVPITRTAARNHYQKPKGKHVSASYNNKYMAHVVSRARTNDEERSARAVTKKRKDTITIKGHVIPWKLDHSAKAAPADEVGAWFGSGSTTDGKTTHFIGHNPGVFSPVMHLKKGDAITVVDKKDHKRVYHVTKVIDMYDWGLDVRTKKNEDYQILEAPGERITLQTCITETINRVVFAK